jgi:hypothetical protein
MRLEDRERRLVTQASARFLGKTLARSRTVTLFEEGSPRVRSHESWSKKRGRRYLFGDADYTVEKLLPSGQVVDSKAFAYPEPAEGGEPPQVVDSYAALLRLRGAGLSKPGDQTRLHVATSGGPRAYRVLVDANRNNARSFEDLATGRHKRLDLQELRLRVVPDDPGTDDGFLDMHDVELWVEAGSCTPLEIGGKVPGVPGRVRLELAALQAAAPASAE